MRVRCTTKFDITETGVTGHFKPSRVPFADRAGRQIVDIITWNHSRNQQRNWETLTQLIGLRTQIDFSIPVRQDDCWTFEFETENETVLGDGVDALALLKNDCQGVPMIVGLGEQEDLDSFLQINGNRSNIAFEVIPVNN